jgi:hypothetical protein
MVLGEETMKKIVVALVTVVALFWSGGVVQAKYSDKPFISLSVMPDILDLGTLPFLTNIYDSPAKLTVKVESNCYHGPIVVSMTELKHKSIGSTITPDRILIKGPVTGGFVPMAKPVVVSKPTTGSHDILLKFKVENKFQDIAGKYTGTIIFTIMPP